MDYHRYAAIGDAGNDPRSIRGDGRYRILESRDLILINLSSMCDKWSQGEIDATEPQFEHYISYLVALWRPLG